MSRLNCLPVILIAALVATLLYAGKLPGLATRAKGVVGLIKAYITGSITRPDHPRMALWGHTSCLRAMKLCLRRARIFAKSGHGANLGGF